jgi:hypothetical protein
MKAALALDHHHVAAAVEHKKRLAAAAIALAGMENSSGGIVGLGGDSSVDSDVEEIVKWDCDLHATKTFLMAAMILSGCKHNSPKLDVQQKNLLDFFDQPAIDYFRLGLLQAMAFKEIKILCYAGWKTETSWKKKWTISFMTKTLHQKQHYVPYYLSIVFFLSLKYAFGIISMFFTLVRCSIILSRLFLTCLHPCFLPMSKFIKFPYVFSCLTRNVPYGKSCLL